MPEAIIYILDPDTRQRQSFLEALEPLRIECRSFQSPTQLLEQLDAQRPGCVLSEIHLPEMTGLELQSLLARDFPCQSVVFSSADADITTSVQAMRQGATDFLQRPIQTYALLRAVNESLAMSELWLQTAQEREQCSSRANDLVEREWQLLPHIAWGCSNKEIATELGIAVRTVEHYRRTLMEKMGVASSLHLLRHWLLLNLRSPRCFEFARHHMRVDRPLPRCPHEQCACVGSVTEAPRSPAGGAAGPFYQSQQV